MGDLRALEALVFHQTTSTGLVKVLEGLVVMDLKATTTLLDPAQLPGVILLPPLRHPSAPSLGMVVASMGHLGSLLPSIPHTALTFKAMVNSLMAMVNNLRVMVNSSNSKVMDSSRYIPASNSRCINSPSILFSGQCIHNPLANLPNPLDNLLKQVRLNSQQLL